MKITIILLLGLALCAGAANLRAAPIAGDSGPGGPPTTAADGAIGYNTCDCGDGTFTCACTGHSMPTAEQTSMVETMGMTKIKGMQQWGKNVRLQQGMVIALKGGKDNKYCADEGETIRCNRGAVGGWEKFTVVGQGGGKIALMGGNKNKLCADEGGNGVKCNRGRVGGWEKFTVEMLGGGKLVLKGGKDNKYCADEGNSIKCNRGRVGGWEKFTLEVLQGGASATKKAEADAAAKKADEKASADKKAAIQAQVDADAKKAAADPETDQMAKAAKAAHGSAKKSDEAKANADGSPEKTFLVAAKKEKERSQEETDQMAKAAKAAHGSAKKGIIDKVKALLNKGGHIGGRHPHHRKGRRHRHRHPSAYDATLDVATAVDGFPNAAAKAAAAKKTKKKKATKTVARPVKKGGAAQGGQCEDYTDLNITPEDAALGAELCSKRCCGDSFDLPGKCWINGKVLAFPVRPCCTLKCPKKLKLKDVPPYTFEGLTKKEIASGAAICAKKCSGSDYPEPIATCFLCGEELTYPNINPHKLECDKRDTEKHKGVKTEEITLEEAKKGVELCKKKCCGATFLGKCRIDDDEFEYECLGGPDWKPASSTIVLPRGALDDPHKPCPECTQKVNVTVPCDGKLPCPCKQTDPVRVGFTCLKGSGKSRAVVASTSNSSLKSL